MNRTVGMMVIDAVTRQPVWVTSNQLHEYTLRQTACGMCTGCRQRVRCTADDRIYKYAVTTPVRLWDLGTNAYVTIDPKALHTQGMFQMNPSDPSSLRSAYRYIIG